MDCFEVRRECNPFLRSSLRCRRHNSIRHHVIFCGNHLMFYGGDGNRIGPERNSCWCFAIINRRVLVALQTVLFLLLLCFTRPCAFCITVLTCM